MVDPTDKNTKHIKEQSIGTEGYLECIEEKEKGKVKQLDVVNEKDQHNSDSYKNKQTNKQINKQTNIQTKLQYQ